MSDGVEEEKFGHDECLDQHDEACRDAGEEDDDVDHPENVENDIACACQRFLEERHFG